MASSRRRWLPRYCRQRPRAARKFPSPNGVRASYGAPFAVGIDKGLFKKAGIDITGVIGSAGGGMTVRNILASDVLARSQLQQRWPPSAKASTSSSSTSARGPSPTRRW